MTYFEEYNVIWYLFMYVYFLLCSANFTHRCIYPMQGYRQKESELSWQDTNESAHSLGTHFRLSDWSYVSAACSNGSPNSSSSSNNKSNNNMESTNDSASAASCDMAKTRQDTLSRRATIVRWARRACGLSFRGRLIKACLMLHSLRLRLRMRRRLRLRRHRLVWQAKYN